MGAVFDSAPCYMDRRILVTALVASMGSVAGFLPTAAKYALAWCFVGVISLLRPGRPRRFWCASQGTQALATLAANGPWLGGFSEPAVRCCRRTNMRHLGLGRKSLYLYSLDDELCNGTKLGELVAARRAAGCDVTELRWGVSRHVSHYSEHNAEYCDAVLTFLRSVAAGQGERCQGS